MTEAQKRATGKWYAKNREKLAAYYKAWRERNRERCAAYSRARVRTDKEKFSTLLKQRYGITREHYRAMIADQCGCCAMCDRQLGPSLAPCIDHDHKTGIVRGILCHRCNIGLDGYERVLQQAPIYLRQEFFQDGAGI